jgi:hypothetical protein
MNRDNVCSSCVCKLCETDGNKRFHDASWRIRARQPILQGSAQVSTHPDGLEETALVHGKQLWEGRWF